MIIVSLKYKEIQKDKYSIETQNNMHFKYERHEIE